MVEITVEYSIYLAIIIATYFLFKLPLSNGNKSLSQMKKQLNTFVLAAFIVIFICAIYSLFLYYQYEQEYSGCLPINSIQARNCTINAGDVYTLKLVIPNIFTSFVGITFSVFLALVYPKKLYKLGFQSSRSLHSLNVLSCNMMVLFLIYTFYIYSPVSGWSFYFEASTWTNWDGFTNVLPVIPLFIWGLVCIIGVYSLCAVIFSLVDLRKQKIHEKAENLIYHFNISVLLKWIFLIIFMCSIGYQIYSILYVNAQSGLDNNDAYIYYSIMYIFSYLAFPFVMLLGLSYIARLSGKVLSWSVAIFIALVLFGVIQAQIINIIPIYFKSTDNSVYGIFLTSIGYYVISAFLTMLMIWLTYRASHYYQRLLSLSLILSGIVSIISVILLVLTSYEVINYLYFSEHNTNSDLSLYQEILTFSSVYELIYLIQFLPILVAIFNSKRLMPEGRSLIIKTQVKKFFYQLKYGCID